MKIAYVILHYLAGKDTIECANSIIFATKMSKHETKIIIVDNGSKNESLNEIKNSFIKNDKIVILHSDINLGFASGNNIGFKYAKEIYKADFIVQLNNDTILSQEDFNEKIVELYIKNGYAILGPDIITKDGYHQNPGKEVNWSRKKIFIFRAKKRVQYILSYFSIFNRFLKINENSYSLKKVNHDVFDTQLHGACLIFSPQYILNFDGMYDKTFLYMEEDILRLMAQHYGFLMMYSPSLEIIHKEDISSNLAANTEIEKKKNIYKYLLDSSRVYVNLKKQFEKDNK